MTSPHKSFYKTSGGTPAYKKIILTLMTSPHKSFYKTAIFIEKYIQTKKHKISNILVKKPNGLFFNT